MLALSRYKGEVVTIDLRKYNLGIVYLEIVDIQGDKVRLSFDADRAIHIDRLEVFESKERNRLTNGDQNP